MHREEILDGEKLPDQIRRLYAVFQAGGRFLRQGRQGIDTPAPVQQGRARQILKARTLLRRA